MKTRADQYREFNSNVSHLLLYCENRDIPIRFGEAHRPWWVALIYATVALQAAVNIMLGKEALPEKKTGIINTKHKYSLAIDYWIYDPATGKKILWDSPYYEQIGKFWEGIGGTAGVFWKGKKKDPPHLEIRGKVL